MGNSSYKSYIAASYVKFVESGGARVVPVLIDQPDEYYQMIFNSTNGLVLPGGTQEFDNSGTVDLIIVDSETSRYRTKLIGPTYYLPYFLTYMTYYQGMRGLEKNCLT